MALSPDPIIHALTRAGGVLRRKFDAGSARTFL
jgi:hypothetical protein